MKLVTRAEWGARDAAGITRAPGMTRGVGVHWLGGGRGPTSHSQCAAKMREVQAFHTGPARGWNDFAYNAGACCHGYVFEGRGPKVRNAANGGGTRAGVDANACWASVLYLAGSDGPELAADGKDAINDAAEWLGVAAGEWLGHSDFLSTECPGDELYVWAHTGHPRGTGVVLPPPLPPEPQEEDMPSPYTLFNWGGAVWAWSGGDPLPLDSWAQVEPYLTQGAVTIGDLSDEQFRSIAPTWSGRHPAAERDAGAQVEAMAAVRASTEVGDPGCSSRIGS